MDKRCAFVWSSPLSLSLSKNFENTMWISLFSQDYDKGEVVRIKSEDLFYVCLVFKILSVDGLNSPL